MDATPITLRIHPAPDGHPRVAVAEARIDRSAARLWAAIVDVERYPGRVPMIHRVQREGDRITVHFRFKLALFSVGFHVVVDAVAEPERSLELRWVSGEPRGLRLRFELTPDGADACVVRAESELDVMSLGWVAKYFLRHHPEIQHGILPGVALNLLDSMRRATGGTFGAAMPAR